MRSLWLGSVVVLALSGCAANPGVPGADAEAPGEPTKSDDSRFAIDGLREAYLVGNQLTAGDDRLSFSVSGSAEVVDLWIDRRFVQRAFDDGGRFAFDVDLAGDEDFEDFDIGEHEILLAADGERYAFAQRFFVRTHPLYVVVSNDWDDPDNADPTLRRQERLHERHPELVVTHFVGPYTFTDPGIAPSRVATLVDWVTGMRDQYGDEIGLHIHPYCSFVESAGVECNTSPSFAYAGGDSTGYTVYLGSYDEDETVALLERAGELFAENGLGKPTSFRAGGWTAEIHNLEALARAGYVADSSACNWERLEEWENHAGASLYAWNKQHWASIDELSQPYYPSRDDILSDAAPTVDLLEVPDNGLLVDYVSGAEMIEMFAANLDDGALETPRVYSIGYHPPNFSELYFERMDEALTHIDGFLASEGAGPVVYARVSDLALIAERP